MQGEFCPLAGLVFLPANDARRRASPNLTLFSGEGRFQGRSSRDVGCRPFHKPDVERGDWKPRDKVWADRASSQADAAIEMRIGDMGEEAHDPAFDEVEAAVEVLLRAVVGVGHLIERHVRRKGQQ